MFSSHLFGEGNGNPLQCSCLENPRDGGAWWAAIYGVTQSRTRLKQLSSSSSHLFGSFLVFLSLLSPMSSISISSHYFPLRLAFLFGDIKQPDDELSFECKVLFFWEKNLSMIFYKLSRIEPHSPCINPVTSHSVMWVQTLRPHNDNMMNSLGTNR